MHAFKGSHSRTASRRQAARRPCPPWRDARGRILFALLATLAAGARVPAAPGPESAGSPVLAALVEEAAARNPDIAAARQRLVAARAAISPARALPDPTLNFSYEDMDVRETMYGVTQELPFPGKRQLKGRIAEHDAARAEQQYQATKLEIVARVKEVYYDLVLAQISAGVIDQTRETLVALARGAEAGYAVGRMAQADVLRAQAEISRSLARRAAVEQQRRSAQAGMMRLLGRTSDPPVVESTRITLTKLRQSPAELAAALKARAPLLQAALHAVEYREDGVALARREYWPDFEVGVLRVHEEPVRDDGYQLMLNVSVPLYYAAKQRHGVREAHAMRQEAADDLQAMHQDLLSRIRDDLAQIERAETLVDLLQNAIIPQARLALDAGRAGYASGRLDFLTVLSSLLTLQENEIELHAEIAAHEQAVARIEGIIGEAP